MKDLSPIVDAMYPQGGRPFIPPEQLIRALLTKILFRIRSERLLMEELYKGSLEPSLPRSVFRQCRH